MARLAMLRAAGTAPEHGPVAASSLDGHRAAFVSSPRATVRALLPGEWQPSP